LHDQLRMAGIYLDENPNIENIIKKHHLQDDPVNNARREKVKEAMLHAWNSYVTYAWGQDELQVFLFHLYLLGYLLPFMFYSNELLNYSNFFLFFLFVLNCSAAIEEWSQ